MKIFLAGNSLRLAYGGPAYSVARLAAALADKGMDVGLWSADDSTHATQFLADPPRVRLLTGKLRDAFHEFGAPDVIHDNGIWLRHHHDIAGIARDLRVSRVVSVRGMLEPWATRHKQIRKWLAWSAYQRRDLTRAACLHATTGVEAANLERFKLGVLIRVITNGVDVPAPPNQRKTRPGDDSRNAFFIGRIYPIKGLPMLIEAWGRARPKGWRLTIAGHDEAGHLAEVKQVVSAAGLDEVVSFPGPLAADAKRSAFENADLFILPTHSESFGMVVAEALAYGLPVLTTTGAPWPQLTEYGCGWRVPPTVEGLARGLTQATSMTDDALTSMGANGRALVAAEYRWEDVAEQFVELYQQL